MNKLRIFMFVAALALAATGCRKTVEISFVENTFEIGAQGGVLEAYLESNGSWNICGAPDWITVSPESGTGNTTLTLTVLPNEGSEIRIGTVDAATKDISALITVTQDFEVGAYLTISPDYYECGEAGGEFDVTVSSNDSWTVSDLPDWIMCSMTSGSGDTTITVTVHAINGEASSGREANLVIGNEQIQKTLHVVQNLDPQISISVEPEVLEMPCEGGSASLAVTCEGAWTAFATANWITLDKTEGEGDSELIVTVTENPNLTPRIANVVLASSTGANAFVSVRQEASPAPHFLEVSPIDFFFSKEGGTQEITIGCDTQWKVDLSSDWLAVSEMIGTGNAIISLIAEPNSFFNPRSAEFFITSEGLEKRLIVTQEAGDEVMFADFVPDTVFASYTGGVYHLELTSNVGWQLESSDWISLMTTSGEGDASIDIIVDYNSAEFGRMGVVRAVKDEHVLGKAVIAQEGKPNILETDITEIDARPEGGEYVVHVTANQSWEVACNVDWISCTPESGFANGEFTISVTPMSSAQPRTGRLKLRGSTGVEIIITVNQHG